MASSRAIAAATLGASALAAATASGADSSISSDPTATNLAAHNGALVWARIGQDGRSWLVERIGGRGRDARIPPKSGLFDPDLGHDRSGHRLIVYTRCPGLAGRDCDLWKLDYARSRHGRESKVTGAASERCSEFAPSVWLGSVAFAAADHAAATASMSSAPEEGCGGSTAGSLRTPTCAVAASRICTRLPATRAGR